jgi:hypothetical protein
MQAPKDMTAVINRLHVDPQLWRVLRMRALEENTTATDLLNRAIAAYIGQKVSTSETLATLPAREQTPEDLKGPAIPWTKARHKSAAEFYDRGIVGIEQAVVVLHDYARGVELPTDPALRAHWRGELEAIGGMVRNLERRIASKGA